MQTRPDEGRSDENRRPSWYVRAAGSLPFTLRYTLQMHLPGLYSLGSRSKVAPSHCALQRRSIPPIADWICANPLTSLSSVIQIIVKCIVEGFSCITLYALGWINERLCGVLLLNDVLSPSIFLLERLALNVLCFLEPKKLAAENLAPAVGVILEKKSDVRRLQTSCVSYAKQHMLSCQKPRAGFGRQPRTDQVSGSLYTEERNRKSFAVQGL